MAYTTLDGKRIYYEVYGEGEPLVILNGIMMSHASWAAFIPELSRDNQLILLDFFDQGKSERMDKAYKQTLQVEVVRTVLDELRIQKACIVGISYGGEIALQFALTHQERVRKLVLFNTTSATNPWLTDIGRGWVQVAKTNDPEAFYHVTIPVIYSPAFYTQHKEWMEQRKTVLYKVFSESYLQAMIRLIESAEGYEVTDRLHEITVDTMIVSGELDYLTPLREQLVLHKNIKHSEHLVISGCGHASMYEKPVTFLSIIKGFCAIVNNLEIV